MAHEKVVNKNRLGGWLPSNQEDLDQWVNDLILEVEAEEKKKPFHPVIEKFQKFIESDPEAYMYFTQMFKQAPPKRGVPKDAGIRRLKNYKQMLRVINHLLTKAPEFNETGMVGFPINAILDYVMITPAGLAAFLSDKINAMFKEVLTEWTKFLHTPESLSVFNDSPKGWKCDAAIKILNMKLFKYQPEEKHWGFKSWNDFFIREFKEGKRKVAEPDNDKVIVSACESTPVMIHQNVKKYDKFWVKSQPYSLEHLLAGHFVERFECGTVYQSYLSAENYHRWHSPVSGTIKKKYNVSGTYYAEAASEGFDKAGPNDSQVYIAHVATRALIFIEADDPSLGWVCVIPVGMAEVSSCQIKVEVDQHVEKGDQLGYFLHGGSSCCLVSQPDVIREFSPNAIPMPSGAPFSQLVKLNSKIATAY